MGGRSAVPEGRAEEPVDKAGRADGGAEKARDRREERDLAGAAMAEAIRETLTSVLGSSITTVAGFIALCFMTFTMGRDLGIVMAKGVLLGVLGCVTVLPSLILVLDRPLQKTKHRSLIPRMEKFSGGVVKIFPVFLIVFLALIPAAYYGYSKTSGEVYYDMGECLPKDMEYVIANSKLQEEFNIASTHTDVPSKNVRRMIKEMERCGEHAFCYLYPACAARAVRRIDLRYHGRYEEERKNKEKNNGGDYIMKHKIIRDMMDRMAKSGNQKRKQAVKLTAAALCAALSPKGTGSVIYTQAAEDNTARKTETDGKTDETTDAAKEAQGGEAANEKGTSENKGTEVEKEKSRSENEKTAGEKIAKEETVYVWANADGSPRKIVVSDWLKNEAKAAGINDVSELADIENVGGDEIFTEKPGNVKVWEAGGSDIYYQGSAEKELPVGLTITYQLDGKEISPEELAGKSGKVKIRFSYTNEQYEYAEVEGVRTKVYVPFAVVTGMVLANDVFTNVEVSGGRMINDGDRIVVIGYGMPGMRENLAVDSDKLDVPDSFEISADVKEFEMGMTVTIATNELFNGVDADNENLVNELRL